MKYLLIIFLLFAVLMNAISVQADTANNGDNEHSKEAGSLTGTVDTFIDSVIVTGIDSLFREEISVQLLSKKGGILNDGLIEYDIKTLTNHLHEHGWWNAHVEASVDSLQNGQMVLTFSVKTGNPVIFGTVSTHITDDKPSFDLHLNKELYGTRFTRNELDAALNGITGRFADNGYPEVSVFPSLSANGDTVDVRLKITTGHRAHFDSVLVRGLTRTKDSIIQRELSHFLGRAADPGISSEVRAIIGRLTYLRLTGDPLIAYDPDGKCILVVNLSEGQQGSFDGVIGYQPSAGKGSGELIGSIDLSLNNIFGTGRSSRIRWENLGTNTEDLEIRYHEPWILGFPYSITTAFTQEERQRQGYTRTILTAGIGRNIGRLQLHGGFRYEKVSADSLYSSRASGFDISARWTAVDTPLNPTSGIQYAAAWSIVSKRYRFITGERNSLERTQFDLDHYIPTFPRQTVAVLLRYRRVNTQLEKLSPSDRWWLGGASTIRGYRESMFPALKALWSTFEYRFITGETSRVFLFVDTGYLVDRMRYGDRFHKKTETLTGYGFGLRLQSRSGTLGFDYGLGKNDSLGEGKLHVRLTTEF